MPSRSVRRRLPARAPNEPGRGRSVPVDGASRHFALAALGFGVVAQFIGETRSGYEWLVDGIAFAIGAVFASEFITAWRAFEPVWDGVALVPALIGGLVVGVVVEVATRLITGGTYSGRPMSA